MHGLTINSQGKANNVLYLVLKSPLHRASHHNFRKSRRSVGRYSKAQRFWGTRLHAGIRRVKGAKRLGLRLGNWLTADQEKKLLAVPSSESVRDKRDHAILALLLGCGLRRAELIGLTLGQLQQRDNHWAIVNLYGKGGHVRTVPIPAWVKAAVHRWLVAGDITSGLMFRRVSRTGTVWGSKISEKLVWWIVKQRAQVIGIDKLVPHDLRRTYARLCHAAGGELEQIQFLLGHRSVETTERYLGSRQRIASAVNVRIGLEPDGTAP
jgi:site-specific recombinase XerD